MPEFKQILNWIDRFSNDDVLLIFNGSDTGTTGHDGEYVAEFKNVVAVWSRQDVISYMKENNLL